MQTPSQKPLSLGCGDANVINLIKQTFITYIPLQHRPVRAVGSSPGVGRLMDQSGDAAKGSEVEARSTDHETFRAKRGKKNFALIFSY